MNVQTWLNQAKTKAPLLDAELILCHALGALDRSFLALHGQDELTSQELTEASSLLSRRIDGEPLAYLTGYKEFYGRNFKVSSSTLIPRPESEAIIRLALKLNPQSILDIGTGSGCLIITLAAELKSPTAKITSTANSTATFNKPTETTFTASDKSPAALEIARENATSILGKHHKINFIESDLLQNIPNPENFDLIIANLPYVDKTWDFLSQDALAYEPDLALYAADHGLAIIKQLIDQIETKNLHPYLILEADPCQHEAIEKYIGQQAKQKDSYALLFKC